MMALVVVWRGTGEDRRREPRVWKRETEREKEGNIKNKTIERIEERKWRRKQS